VIQDEQLLQASKQTQAHSQQREQHAADWLQQQQQKQQMCKTDVRSQHHAPKLQLADFIIGRYVLLAFIFVVCISYIGLGFLSNKLPFPQIQ